MKSDQSDIKARVSSSDFDERAEYEETVDSGSGFGDEKFEESVGFTSMRIDPKVIESERKDSTDSDKVDEPEVVFKKMVPKRHSRTESISISKLSDLQDFDIPKQDFQIIITEAEDVNKSFEKDEASDKISSESSREIEISDRKSSEGMSDRISSEDAVTEKKTSSEEDFVKDQMVTHQKEIITTTTTAVAQVLKESSSANFKPVVAKEEVLEKGTYFVFFPL